MKRLVASLARAALAFVLASAPAARAAETRTNPGQVRAAAERLFAQYAPVGGTVHATAAPLDARLTLAPCVGELTPALPPGATVRARTTVVVRCPDAGGWSILVPVAVETEATLLVAKRALARGESPVAADVEPVTRRVPGLANAYVMTLGDFEGRRLMRPVAAGEVVPLASLAARRLVESGQRLTLVAMESGIAVRAQGVALAPGGHGDRIRVRNAASGRELEGRIQGDGTVALGP